MPAPTLLSLALTIPSPTHSTSALGLGQFLPSGPLFGSSLVVLGVDLSCLPHPPAGASSPHVIVLPPSAQHLAIGGHHSDPVVPSSPTPFALGFCVGSPTTSVSDLVLDLDALAAGDAWVFRDSPRIGVVDNPLASANALPRPPFVGQRSFARVARFAT
ncbi:hypothetical protein SUGI_1101540 [Cryptomeria japonica]|nr:hypothetical protein SUGI_1101540 [Cryptomeria japonica]